MMDSLETNETTALRQSAELVNENAAEPVLAPVEEKVEEVTTPEVKETPAAPETTEDSSPETEAPVEETEVPTEEVEAPAEEADAPAEEVIPAEEASPETEVEAEETTEEVTAENATTDTENETPTEEADKTEEETPQYQSKEEVVARLKELSSGEEIPSKSEIDLLKVLFYKFHNAEIQEEHRAFIEGGGDPDKFMPRTDSLEPEFRAYMQVVRERRAAAQEAMEKQKQENLQRKLEILERIQQLASTPEEANKAFEEFKALQAEWKEIKAVPAERATELWKNYQLYVENFYDLLKLGHELRDYDFRKNLEAKTRLCEQAEALADVNDVIQAFNQLQGLHQEWKETGPVAKDLRDEIWERFKAASTVINKRHQAHFEELKAREEQNLADKTALCEELEGIQTDGLKTFADWDKVTKQIIELQARWKTIGFAPQKVNTQIFERFRQGCDAFFEQKSQFFRDLKEGLAANLAKKKELVEKAEALMDSTDWRSAGDAMINLQKQWKEIGAVPRKYSEALWKRFVGACDHFFEARKEATSGQREQEKANLQQKKDIIQQLKDLAEKEGEETIQKVRELQQQWNEAGHVPFRDKDKIYKEYREICDKIYDSLNISQARRRLNNFRAGLAQKAEQDGSNLTNERNRMMFAYEKLRDEIKTYENNLGFLTANSKKGNAMVDAMKKKVDKLRDELNLLAQKIKAVDEQMEGEE